ncbi:hypothetical protein [Frankia sp. Cj3]|uniref:hypothetical protein n=1 Tax=Frankia sp. Cj3 TaxID=2880976 RepID=UPI001EF3EC66|nr:hypothetical protein [Frankia sp. Cj3]
MYYRLHANPDAPCFCADHAYSGPWGSEFSADGSHLACGWCQGAGIADIQDCPQCACGWAQPCGVDGCEGGALYGQQCRPCDGTGWVDAQRGYSACSSPEELVEYMDAHGCVDSDDTVVIFDGRWVGTGFDGEDLVVPAGSFETITWAELTALVRQ